MFRKTLTRILLGWLLLLIITMLFGKVTVSAADNNNNPHNPAQLTYQLHRCC